MKHAKHLVTGLIGLALLAAPFTAAAKDNDKGGNNSHQARVEAHQARDAGPAHEARHEAREQHSDRVETRNFARAPEIRHEAREQHEVRNFNREPAMIAHPARPVVADRDWRQDRHEANRDWRQDRREANPDWRQDRNEARRDWREDRNEHNRWNHGYYHDYRDYYGYRDRNYDREYASGWVMPYGYSGGACGWARHLRTVYNQDLYWGHPAAAQDLLPRLRRAERTCSGYRYGYNGRRYGYNTYRYYR